MKMAAKDDNDNTEIQQSEASDKGLLFENLLAEVTASDCNDRTKLLIDAINNEIKDVMQAVNRYSKNGKITINLYFDCVRANEMNISADVVGKKPKERATGTKMYRDLKGRLYLDDPNQTKLFDIDKVRSIKKEK